MQLKLYPGISPQIVDAVINSDAQAIIMETFGAGNTTTAKWFLDKLRSAINSGKIILDISQCKVGSVEMGRYQTSSELKKMGVVNGYDMTFEAAVTKLMYLLGRNYPKDRLLRRLRTSLRGELTQN
jgi:L-asparaginase